MISGGGQQVGGLFIGGRRFPQDSRDGVCVGGFCSFDKVQAAVGMGVVGVYRGFLGVQDLYLCSSQPDPRVHQLSDDLT